VNIALGADYRQSHNNSSILDQSTDAATKVAPNLMSHMMMSRTSNQQVFAQKNQSYLSSKSKANQHSMMNTSTSGWSNFGAR